jgi:hypothetical protein
MHSALRDARRAIRCRRLSGASPMAALAGAAHRVIRPRRTILFAPQTPMPMYIVYKLCAVLGYRMETDPRRPYDLGFRFCDKTFNDSILPVAPGTRVINAAATDVSKAWAQECWGAAAGYPLRIDPTRHVGPAVCKANANAAHDGRIVQCPITEVEPSKVYQRLIDNTYGCAPGMVMEYRIAIHGDRIPVVYLKYRPVAARFNPLTNTRIELHDPMVVFTDRERAALVRCAKAMGLDFCDMDVLRDVRDGRIYAVDVNCCSFGPPVKLERARGRALRLLADSFQGLVEDAERRLY